MIRNQITNNQIDYALQQVNSFYVVERIRPISVKSSFTASRSAPESGLWNGLVMDDQPTRYVNEFTFSEDNKLECVCVYIYIYMCK